MKHIWVFIVFCAAVCLATDVLAGGRGSGRRSSGIPHSRGIFTRTYKTSTSRRSTGGHGIHGCGVKNCHGAACHGGSSSFAPASSKTYDNTLKGIRTANSVVRTVNNTVRTIDYHKRTEKDLEYKDLRNEKLRRELETGRQIARPVIIIHEDSQQIEDSNISDNQEINAVNEKVDTKQNNEVKPDTSEAIRILKKPNNSTFVDCPNCEYSLHQSRKKCPKCGLKVRIV